MQLANVKLIFRREVRDQLRDRRTLFMIAVLPMLLYPLMGLSFFQLVQFLKEHPTRVLVVGGEKLSAVAEIPALFDENMQFSKKWFAGNEAKRAELVEATFFGAETAGTSDEERLAIARREIQSGQYEAALVFPSDFSERLEAFRQTIADETASDEKPREAPSPEILFNTARESSRIAEARLGSILARWKSSVGDSNLKARNVRPEAIRPFRVESKDVAEPAHRDAATWSKALPFILIIWALTGAFYPAVDLCAGEKERGTLETLLSSPAERSEIVVGKLLTVMLFSVATAALNLLSMGVTGGFIVEQLGRLNPAANFGMPPLLALVWLALALPLVSALFSALCLGLAALARSSKEGQYYLMPLILVTLPLMVLSMAPGVELTLGSSLIPVTGLMLLLREALQGNYSAAAVHVAPVLGITLLGCWLAVRWAVDQFNSESTLFRESERLDLVLSLKRLFSERHATPTAAMGIACGVLLLIIRFFVSFIAPADMSPERMLDFQAATLVLTVAAPVLLLSCLFTRSVKKTLLLKAPPLGSIGAAVLLAVAIHPLAILLHKLVAYLYPTDERLTDAIAKQFEFDQLSITTILFVFAFLPAVCEELAFRGFILSGLRHMGRTWRAIVVSSVFFGVTHTIFQQSVGAVVLGLALGFLAVQTGSIWPSMAFHFTHNAMMLSLSRIPADGAYGQLIVDGQPGEYHPAVAVCGAVVAVAILYWYSRMSAEKLPEEALQEAIDRENASLPAPSNSP